MFGKFECKLNKIKMDNVGSILKYDCKIRVIR